MDLHPPPLSPLQLGVGDQVTSLYFSSLLSGMIVAKLHCLYDRGQVYSEWFSAAGRSSLVRS